MSISPPAGQLGPRGAVSFARYDDPCICCPLPFVQNALYVNEGSAPRVAKKGRCSQDGRQRDWNLRPSPTAYRHMHSIHDNKPPVKLHIGGDSYAPPVRGDSGSAFDSHDQVSIAIEVENASFPLKKIAFRLIDRTSGETALTPACSSI